MKPMRDFTHGELDWRPWLAPLDLNAATEQQLVALKVTPSNRAVGAYSLVLAHDPEALAERSPRVNPPSSAGAKIASSLPWRCFTTSGR